MAAVIEALRSGSWITRERARMVACALLAAFSIGALFLIATSDGLNDRLGRPLGTDFSNVYAAGTYVLEGKATAPFDPAKQFAREQAIFGRDTQFYGWHYPPFFLSIAALLALIPYALALALWQGATLALYVFSIRTIFSASPSPGGGGSRATGARGGVTSEEKSPPPGELRSPTSPLQGEVKKEWLSLVLAFPAVFINLGHGHNGFLTAALITGALLQLDKRPIVAGILFGLLAYKPQFGLLIPFVLAASGRWRTFIAAAATVLVFGLAITAAFGAEVWRAFFESMRFTREVVLERGDTGWHKIQSVFSWARMWGASVDVAYIAQATVTLCIGGATVWLWRSRVAFALKAVALLIATLLATPYSLDYDLMLLAPAIALLAVHGLANGFVPFEKTLLAAAWLMPLLARSIAQVALIPLAVPLMMSLFVLIMSRALAPRAQIISSLRTAKEK